jgi:hypothetical protein
MPENGAKTVENWRPKHEGCYRSFSRQKSGPDGLHFECIVGWTKPPVKGLDRYAFFEVGCYVGDDVQAACDFLDHQVESEIDRIVHEDSVRLLARGKRTQTADTDRYKGEMFCPV